MPEAEARNPIERFFNCLGRTVQAPGTWVKGKTYYWLCNGADFHCISENIVKPNQQSYPWYHHKFRRVPTIDQCYEDDRVCIYEADEQFKRDKKVDNEILNILRQRYEDCVMYERPDNVEKCTPLWKYYKQAEENWFIKCEYKKGNK